MPTPYEQRFNYYMAAKDLLTEQYHSKYNETRDRTEKGEQFLKYPIFPTADEIFLLADAIKAFSEKK